MSQLLLSVARRSRVWQKVCRTRREWEAMPRLMGGRTRNPHLARIAGTLLLWMDQTEYCLVPFAHRWREESFRQMLLRRYVSVMYWLRIFGPALVMQVKMKSGAVGLGILGLPVEMSCACAVDGLTSNMRLGVCILDGRQYARTSD